MWLATTSCGGGGDGGSLDYFAYGFTIPKANMGLDCNKLRHIVSWFIFKVTHCFILATCTCDELSS